MCSAPERIEGSRIALRFAVPDDAGYIYKLRMDPTYNRYLSPVTGTVNDQRCWLEGYKRREAQGHEYYYVSERLDDARSCGLVRLYNLSDDSFTWGSWIVDHNKPPKAALESALLSFTIGFEHLGRVKAFVDVRHENKHAIAFYRRFGMQQIDADEQNLYFEYERERFLLEKQARMNLLQEL